MAERRGDVDPLPDRVRRQVRFGGLATTIATAGLTASALFGAPRPVAAVCGLAAIVITLAGIAPA